MSIALPLAVALFAGLPLPLQEDVDSELERLAGKLAPEGPAGTLAGLMNSDAGRLAVKERIAEIVALAVDRYDRDPISWYERLLFAEDAEGNLRVRPERKEEVERLAREVARRTRGWEAFGRQGEELAARIPEDGELGKRLKGLWSNPDYRMALYQKIGRDSREPDAEYLFTELMGRGLHRGSDGRLRLRGNYRDETLVAEASARAEAANAAGYEEHVAKTLARLHPDPKKLLSTPEGRFTLARRLAQLAADGAEDPVARLFQTDLEGSASKGFTFKAAARGTLDEAAALAALSLELKPILERAGAGMADATEGDRKVKEILLDEAARPAIAFLARQTLVQRRQQQDAAIAQFRDDHLAAEENGALSVRKGRFVNDQGQDSPDAVTAEGDALLAEFAANRATFAEIASRALDRAVVETYESRPGLSALLEHLTEVLETRKQAVRASGLERFVQSTLVGDGGSYRVRPERAGRVEEMARRAAEIQKNLDRAGGEEEKKP